MNAPSTRTLAQVDAAWAWAPFEPGPDGDWDLAAAAHLYRRAGFGATWGELGQAMAGTPAAAVERLVHGGEGSEAFEKHLIDSARSLLSGSKIENLAGWWLYGMLNAPRPLHERMTLFWHGHFATSFAKVRHAELIFQQHQVLRRHALGRFGDMLTAIARDPAMLLWLDSATNRRSHPNENFAREVMELFCLGLGNYSEDDIREAARAFTGWEVRHKQFTFNRYQYDDGLKTVLGKTGRWSGDDVLAILLEHPATARFLTTKLFRHFITETEEPPARLIEPLADEYRRRDYDTAWLLQSMLGSKLFFSPLARRQKIKAPVELAVGLLRGLEGTTNYFRLARDVATLGQALFEPPTVKGWNGGREWLHSAAMVGRLNLVWALVSGTDPEYGTKCDVAALLARQGIDSPPAAIERLSLLLLGEAPPSTLQVKLAAVATGPDGQDRLNTDRLRYARLVQALAALPEFQLA